MADIVTRLRECWCTDDYLQRGLVDPACDHDSIRSEAADEIERLRELVHVFHLLAKRFYEQTEQAAQDARNAFDEAVGHG